MGCGGPDPPLGGFGGHVPPGASTVQVANAIAQAREAAAWLGDTGEGHGGWSGAPGTWPEDEEEEDGDEDGDEEDGDEEDEGSGATPLFENLRDWEKELRRLGAEGWRVSAVNERFDMAPRYHPHPGRRGPRAPAPQKDQGGRETLLFGGKHLLETPPLGFGGAPTPCPPAASRATCGCPAGSWTTTSNGPSPTSRSAGCP